MDLSIIVVNWNTRELLQRCLASVYDTIRGLSFEVIVVDNGSTDGSPEMVASVFSNAILLRNEENRGFAAANNQAMRIGSGRHVLLLNSDAELRDHAAARMVEFLDANPRVGAVGGKLLNPDGSFQNSFADFPGLLSEILLLTGLSRWFCPPGFPSSPEESSRDQREVDWVSGALLMAKSVALASVGLLDEDYFMYVEEVDWCYRMKQSGWLIFYLPDAQAVHCNGGSYRRVPERKRAQLYRSKWLFMRKHRGWLRSSTYLFLVRTLSLCKLVAWFALGFKGTPTRREYARRNVVSYRTLLAEL